MGKQICVLSDSAICVYYSGDNYVLLLPGANEVDGPNKAALEACMKSDRFKSLQAMGQVVVVDSLSEVPWSKMPLEVQQSRRRQLQAEQAELQREAAIKERAVKVSKDTQELAKALAKQSKITHVDSTSGAVRIERAGESAA